MAARSARAGPRYCPSVEDKIVRFPDVARHQLFLEPEGHDTTELYVNGLSTSLPAEVQLELLHAIPGLEQARMTRAGYAIEYDYFPPTQLDASLQVKALGGLYFAGQINGTTGYEEAAGQGVVAGMNAALAVRGEPPVIFGRENSYIGVLVDDLVTRGVDEPYRLFTSRSEFRLTVRQDNALRRLAPMALALGMLDDRERQIVEKRFAMEAEARALAEATSVRPEQIAALLSDAGSTPLPHAMRVAEIAKRQNMSLAALFEATGVGMSLDREVLITAELELKYAGYFERERVQAEKMKRMGDFPLPPALPYERAAVAEHRGAAEVGCAASANARAGVACSRCESQRSSESGTGDRASSTRGRHRSVAQRASQCALWCTRGVRSACAP